MTDSTRRRIVALIILLAILALIALLISRCQPEPSTSPTPPAPQSTDSQPAHPADSASTTFAPTTPPDEVLAEATLTAAPQVAAGAAFTVTWTGPNNDGDYVTIVRPDAPATAHLDYRITQHGSALQLTAPMDAGVYELRYVTSRSRTILGRAPIEVTPVGATIDAPDEVTLGSTFAVAWTGPNNRDDYITIVPVGTPDNQYGNYTETARGSPLQIRAPVVIGDAELRYVSGQGQTVLARRPIRIVSAEVSITAVDEVVAGQLIEVTWTGPNNAGDYITAVMADTPDGQYGNYTITSTGSPLKLLMPITPGSAELRYMTGQGNKVLGRRSITIVAAVITLNAPAEGAAGSEVSITWTGPNNDGDYITVVPKDTPDGRYGHYANTTKGSPLMLKLPDEPCDAEIRYMSGQGGKVLARIPIKVTN